MMMNIAVLSVLLATAVTADHELENKTLRFVQLDNMVEPWKGFFDDFLSELKSNLGFETTSVAAQNYGVKNAEGKWIGQVGKLVDGEADFSLSELTITAPREDVIDFSVPFITSGVTVLIKKSDVDNMTKAQDLAEQDDVAYGCVKTGSTAHFLQTVNDTGLNQIYQKIENSTWFVNNPNEGFEKVKAGKFALFTESWQAEYQILNSCDLQQLGGLLNSIGYGIGFPKNSPHKEHFNKVITEMIEGGKIQQLKEKHWRKVATSNCITKP
jgi:ABC-type amino acid transport substrate-binding protein